MTDIEKKALALLNECGWGGAHLKRAWNPRYEALCRAIEQHEAFRQEVSDVCSDVRLNDGLHKLDRFIIPKPDPLVEVLADMGLKPKGGYDWASEFRNALAARGLEIREKQP